MQNGKIYIGNDHGGYDLKCRIIALLAKENVPFEDFGCASTDIVRYPYYAAKVAQKVQNEEGARGILICSTGIGMSILANRFARVRATLCTNSFMAKMTRLHNDSNILCLGGQVTGYMQALDILDIWLSTKFEGGRHSISLGLLEDAENAIAKTGKWQPQGEHL